MDALLAKGSIDDAVVRARLESWTRIADMNRNAPSREVALRERIGRWLIAVGRPDEAVPQLRQALELGAATAPAAGLWSGCNSATAALAEALLVTGATAEAEILLRTAIGSFPQSESGEPPATQPAPDPAAVECAYWLAEALRKTNRPHEALPLAEAALAGGESATGASDPQRATLRRIQRARLLSGMARPSEAFDELQQIHRASVAERGDGHWLTQVAAAALGETEARLSGRVQDGLKRLIDAAGGLLTSLPSTAWPRIDTLSRCIELLEFRREWDKAEAVLRSALTSLEAEKRPVPPAFVPAARLALARNLIRQQKLADAQALASETIQSLRSSGESALDGVLADALLVAADAARRRKLFPEAHQLCNEAQQICARSESADAAVCSALCRLQRGWIMLNEEDFPGAEEELKDAVTVLREKLGDSDWRSGQARLVLGEVRYRQMRLEEAEEDIVYGTRIVVGRRGPDEDGLRGLRLCVDLYETWGNGEMATHYRRMLPESHAHDENETGE